jgi:hypothetical protein
MANERAHAADFPSVLAHKHGLSEWVPMLPERSGETIVPGQPPSERLYRCQRVGCDAQVRIGAGELRTTAAAGSASSSS